MTDTDTRQGTEPERDMVRITARAWERDRYLAALLGPRSVRADLMALAAFAGEIARIPAYVHEPMMGEIRLQWWRDAILAPSDSPPSGHPIADALRAAIDRHGLPQNLLIGFIDAQAFGLDDGPIADGHMLMTQLAKTEGALFELALMVLGRHDATARAAALAAGRAYGLARLLVEMPALWAQGRTLIPVSRLQDAGLSLDDYKAGLSPEQLQPVVSGLAAEDRENMIAAHRLSRDLTGAQHVALLPLAVVEPYLQALEKPGRDLLREPIDITPMRRVWCLWRAYRSRRF
ncbi:phytoene/squalene synthase family protein [Leptospira interrogans]